MTSRKTLLPTALLIAFAASTGHFAFRTLYPAVAPEYVLRGSYRPFTFSSSKATSPEETTQKDSSGPASSQQEAPSKHLYLRSTWHLARQAQRAWLQVIGHDRLDLFVNGQLVTRTRKASKGRLTGIVADVSPYLTVGRNSIAIHASQLVMHRPPAVAVAGACVQADGSEIDLGDPARWRASNVYERQGDFWYAAEFDEQHWSAPSIGDLVRWRVEVAAPPTAVSTPRQSSWITPAASRDGAAILAQTFDLPKPPRESWLRVQSTGSFQLAINGSIVADHLSWPAEESRRQPKEYVLDVGSYLKTGSNAVALTVRTAGESPRLKADLHAVDDSGAVTYVATDESWLSKPGYAVDWTAPPIGPSDEWRPCRAEAGYLGVLPWRVEQELLSSRRVTDVSLPRTAKYVGLVLLCGGLGWLGSWLVGLLLRRIHRDAPTAFPPALAAYPLLPATVAAASGILMTYDVGYSGDEIYRTPWLLGLFLIVVAQWLALVIIATAQRAPGADSLGWSKAWQPTAAAAAMIVIASVALWLRLENLLTEPLHHDEVGAYRFTQGVLETGFPGSQVHPDLPYGKCATSELAYYPTAFCALFTDDPRLTLRVPAVFWSMATLLLLFYVGLRLFNGTTGLIAATFYAVSPHVIGISNFGRYLSQVQFFALLTVFLAYEAFRGTGAVNRKYLWATGLSLICTYLSWEGSGFIALGIVPGVLLVRRRNLRPVFTTPAVYAVAALVLFVVLGQNAHRVLQQTQRLWYGEGISALTLKPMWRFPFFEPEFFMIQSSWIRDALLPMAGLIAGCFLAIGHRFRGPLRFLLAAFLTNAGLMSAILPLRTNRYSYHLTPLLILIASAALMAGVTALMQVGRQGGRVWPSYRRYAAAVAGACLVAAMVLGSGYCVQTAELETFATGSLEREQLRFPDWQAPLRYVKDRLREGDAVIAIYPHITNFLLSDGAVDPDAIALNQRQPRVDYWLQTTMILQATLGDRTSLPLDRRSGAVMISNLDELKQVFSEHDRVWYCVTRAGQSHINDLEVSKFLRENMDVVYEDFATGILLRDANHRPAPQWIEQEETERLATEAYFR